MTELTAWSARAHHLAAGGALSLIIVLGTATLSAWPTWQSLAPDSAVVRLSFTHSGARSCRDRTAEEIAGLPRNMRNAQLCERRRAPVRIEIDIDGKSAFVADLPPSGLAGSGPSRVYRRIKLPAGNYRLTFRMRDDPAVKGFTHEANFDIVLKPAQSIAVDFDPNRGGFFLH
jgi:hypothetical protein